MALAAIGYLPHGRHGGPERTRDRRAGRTRGTTRRRWLGRRRTRSRSLSRFPRFFGLAAFSACMRASSSFVTTLPEGLTPLRSGTPGPTTVGRSSRRGPLPRGERPPGLRGRGGRAPSGRGTSARGASERDASVRGPLERGASGRAFSGRGATGRPVSGRDPAGRMSPARAGFTRAAGCITGSPVPGDDTVGPTSRRLPPPCQAQTRSRCARRRAVASGAAAAEPLSPSRTWSLRHQ